MEDPACIADTIASPEFCVHSRKTAPGHASHANISDALVGRVWASDITEALAKTNKQRLKLIKEGKLNKRSEDENTENVS